jgi:formate/nitrite transporter FocA (FNT family)
MALAGRSVVDKVVAIVFPISAFVAAGFEHSVANLYFFPLAMLLQAFGPAGATADPVTWAGFLGNLGPVILGNIVGGSVLVALAYYVIYVRPGEPDRMVARTAGAEDVRAASGKENGQRGLAVQDDGPASG